MSATALCAHGREGFCYDEATPQQRADVDFLHRSAFNYVEPYGDAALAEDYATWLVRDSWITGEGVDLEGSHRRDFARFLDQRV